MNGRFARFIALLPLLLIHSVYAQEAEVPNPSDEVARSNLLWDVSSGGGILENYAKLTLGLSKRVSANASLTQTSDGTLGISATINRNSEKAWIGLSYKSIEVSNDIATQSLALNTGRVVGDWDFSLTPRYTRTSIYGQKGSKQSSAIGAPGVSLGATHHGKKMDVGADAGVNFYSSRLDSYINDSRMIGRIGLQSQLTTTGLEQAYWSAFMTRYHAWGNWGLDYLDTVSAVDLNHSQSVAVRMVYYFGKQWDLRLGLMQSVYAGTAQNTVTLGAKYFW